MSQDRLIREGQIQKRVKKKMQAIADAKASLRSLVNTAAYARGLDIERINTDELESHLNRLIEKKEEAHQLQREIEELEY